MKYAFIQQQSPWHAVRTLCRVLGVSRSGYYRWRRRPPSRRQQQRDQLAQHVYHEFQRHKQRYGYRRLHIALNRAGHRCGRNQVWRLMQALQLKARGKRPYRVTTQANRAHKAAPNWLQQHFQADKPNQKWVTDITYIRTQQGWLYLAAIMDLFSRKIVGWHMGPRITQELTLTALKMAIRHRRPPHQLLHHSDRGSQYTAGAYQKLLARHHMLSSMSRTGNCYDNAPMESFFGTLKRELEWNYSYPSLAQARTAIFEYIEIYYNRQRLHSALEYWSPTQYENLFFQCLQK